MFLNANCTPTLQAASEFPYDFMTEATASCAAFLTTVVPGLAAGTPSPEPPPITVPPPVSPPPILPPPILPPPEDPPPVLPPPPIPPPVYSSHMQGDIRHNGQQLHPFSVMRTWQVGQVVPTCPSVSSLLQPHLPSTIFSPHLEQATISTQVQSSMALPQKEHFSVVSYSKSNSDTLLTTVPGFNHKNKCTSWLHESSTLDVLPGSNGRCRKENTSFPFSILRPNNMLPSKRDVMKKPVKWVLVNSYAKASSSFPNSL